MHCSRSTCAVGKDAATSLAVSGPEVNQFGESARSTVESEVGGPAVICGPIKRKPVSKLFEDRLLPLILVLQRECSYRTTVSAVMTNTSD